MFGICLNFKTKIKIHNKTFIFYKNNAICGWTDQRVGQRIYGGKKDITVIKGKISKIEYPINRELREL